MSTTTTDETLFDLHRSGQLIRRYPEVQDRLTELTGADFAKAGQLLGRLDPDKVIAEHPSVAAVTVAVTGHGTLAQLVAPLTGELARHGLLTRTVLSDFDTYVFDLGDPDSDLYRAGADLTLCVLDPMVIFDEVPVPWTAEDVERVAREKQRVIGGLAARFQEVGRGTLVLNTLPLPGRFPAQLVDHKSRARLSATWHETNAFLLRLAAEHPAVVVLDLAPLVAEGIPVTDPRLSLYARAHLSPELLARYAREIGHLARHLTGRTKKALVLDLDGTVWGGVLGDDGPDGVEVAGGHRGAAYRAFQQVVKQLGAQGILLAAVSKNDQEPVEAVFRDHPDMTLRHEDFVRIIANWRPKHDNLKSLAESLNIAVGSFVFVDDSPFECGLIRQELPEVAVVGVDAEPALHIGALLRDGWFDTRELTTDDRSRSARYRDELVRKDFLDTFDSIEEYLHGLGITVRLTAATSDDISRLSQLTLRTNQFNLTVERLQPAQVRQFITAPDRFALVVRSEDRFGDNGVVGAMFARRAGDIVHIDNFLLSCRVFSRGIEQTCLSALLRHAHAEGAVAVHSAYRTGPKNGKVKDFYARNGFVRTTAEESAATFRHDLTDISATPGHIHLIEDFEVSRP